MATQMSYDDYNTYLKNKQNAESQHAQTGQWNAALGQQNQAIRDKYGMGADSQNAQQFENAYAWMYNGQNQQQQSTPYDTAYNNVKAQYDAARQQAQTARQAATKQAIAGIENMRPGIQQSAEEQARQAYVNNQRNVNMLPWQMKMLGLTGGASESSMVGENARFGNLHGQILSNRENQLRELENAKQQAQMQGDYDIASLQSDFARQGADIYAQMAGRQLDDDIDTMRWNRQTARDDYLRADERQYQDTIYQRNIARENELIQQGYSREDAIRQAEQEFWYKQQDYTHGQSKDLMGLEQQYNLARMGYANSLEKSTLNYRWANDPQYKETGYDFSDLSGDGGGDVTGGDSIPSFSSPDAAASYLNGLGIPASATAGIMPEKAWNSQKTSLLHMGGSSSAPETTYSTYADYLAAYVRYSLEKYKK